MSHPLCNTCVYLDLHGCTLGLVPSEFSGNHLLPPSKKASAICDSYMNKRGRET